MSGRIGRTTVVYFGSQVARTGAGFFATWFIANRLGSQILGEYSVVVGLLFFLNVPASAVGRAMNKRMSETGEHRTFLGAGHALNAAFSVALVAVVVLAGDQVNALANGRPVALALAALVVAQGLFDLVVESLRGVKFVERSGLLKTVEQVLRSTLQIAVIVASAGFVWLVVGHAVAVFVAAVVGALALWKRPALPTRRHVRSLLEYARYGWLGTMKTRAFAWTDTVVLGLFAASTALGFAGVTHSQIGVYKAAWALASTLGLLSVSINQTLFPEISDLSAGGDYAEVRHLVDEGLAFTGLFVIPGLVGAAVIGGDLLAIYGAEFARGKWILVVLVGARLFSSFNRQFVNAISAVDRPDLSFRVNLVFLSVNLVGNVVLIALFGWYGAAVATMLTSGVSLVLAAYVLESVVGGLRVPTRTVGTEVVAAAVMGAVVFAGETVAPPGPVPAVGLAAVGAAVYFVALFGLSARFRTKCLGFAPV
jgi:O-antigen/teichoic acid export membrane protein